MKKVILSVLGVGVLAVAGFLAYAATRPPAYHIERSLTINASAERVFPILSDFNRFPEWSPWEKLDPTMKRQITGEGVGATYVWAGNDKVGEGKMTIEKLVPGQEVDVRLEFIKPFASVCQTKWSLTSEGDKTTVTWAMDGENKTLMEKVFGVLMDMNKLVGADFERGLNNLKSVAEGAPTEEPTESTPTPPTSSTP